MKVYEKEDFIRILGDYDIGIYKKHEPLEHVHENIIAFWTDQGKYVLKELRDINLDEYLEQIKFIDFLHSKKVKVVRNIKSLSGEEIINYQKNLFIIQEFVEGEHPKTLSLELIKNLARKIALMNKVSLESSYSGKINKTFEDKDLSGMGVCKEIGEIQKRNTKRLNEVNKDKFLVCQIHGDLSEGNILVEGDKVVAFIDFDDSGVEYIIDEVGIFIAHAFVKRSGGIMSKEIKIFLEAYEKVLKISMEEKVVLFDFVLHRLFSMLFWYKRFFSGELGRFRENIKRLEEIILKFEKFMHKKT